MVELAALSTEGPKQECQPTALSLEMAEALSRALLELAREKDWEVFDCLRFGQFYSSLSKLFRARDCIDVETADRLAAEERRSF